MHKDPVPERIFGQPRRPCNIRTYHHPNRISNRTFQSATIFGMSKAVTGGSGPSKRSRSTSTD